MTEEEYLNIIGNFGGKLENFAESPAGLTTSAGRTFGNAVDWAKENIFKGENLARKLFDTEEGILPTIDIDAMKADNAKRYAALGVDPEFASEGISKMLSPSTLLLLASTNAMNKLENAIAGPKQSKQMLSNKSLPMPKPFPAPNKLVYPGPEWLKQQQLLRGFTPVGRRTSGPITPQPLRPPQDYRVPSDMTSNFPKGNIGIGNPTLGNKRPVPPGWKDTLPGTVKRNPTTVRLPEATITGLMGLKTEKEPEGQYNIDESDMILESLEELMQTEELLQDYKKDRRY